MHRYNAEKSVRNEGKRKDLIGSVISELSPRQKQEIIHAPQQGVTEGDESRKQFNKGTEVDIVESSLFHSGHFLSGSSGKKYKV